MKLSELHIRRVETPASAYDGSRLTVRARFHGILLSMRQARVDQPGPQRGRQREEQRMHCGPKQCLEQQENTDRNLDLLWKG